MTPPWWHTATYSNSVAYHLHVISDVVPLPIRLRWCIVAITWCHRHRRYHYAGINSIFDCDVFNTAIASKDRYLDELVSYRLATIVRRKSTSFWFKNYTIKEFQPNYSLSLSREGSSGMTWCRSWGKWLFFPVLRPLATAECSNLRAILCGKHKEPSLSFDGVMNTVHRIRSPVNNPSGMLKWMHESK